MGSVRLSRRISAVVFFAVSLLTATLLVGLAAAQGSPGNQGNGNGDAAALCRGDGYKNLTRQDGTPFTSVGECVNYAATNGGVEVLATITPEPSPSPVPSPTPDTGTTSLTLINDLPGTCRALASASGLEPGIGYIITMEITWEDGTTELRSVTVPETHFGYYSSGVGWLNVYGTREIYATLSTADGVELNRAGPLLLDDECAAP